MLTILCSICLLVHVLTVRDGERERETFWLLGHTLMHGKGPIGKQREDKLSRDLPSRSSLDRLNVILFNLSTSSQHEEDRTAHTTCHTAVPKTYSMSAVLTFKYVKYKPLDRFLTQFICAQRRPDQCKRLLAVDLHHVRCHHWDKLSVFVGISQGFLSG